MRRANGILRARIKANTGGIEIQYAAKQRSKEMFGKKIIVTSIVGLASVALPAFAVGNSGRRMKSRCRRSAAS